MSSPSKRSTRSSTAGGTPRRSTRNNPDADRSTPAPADEEAQQRLAETPRTTRRSQLASSPLFYESSPAQSANGRRNAPANGDVSSPLRNMSNSQSTAAGPAPSSPLRQDIDTQSTGDGDRTPRASGMMRGKDFTGVYACNALTCISRIVTNPIRSQLESGTDAGATVRLAQ